MRQPDFLFVRTYEIMNGRTVVTSAYRVACLAFAFTFPQETASLIEAPLRDPSNSDAVVT